MKKINFNFKSIVLGKARWLLTIFAILTLGVGQVWAYNCDYANVYYDNSVTQWTYVQLLYENSGGSTGWNMSHVAHTDLYWKAPGAWSSNNFSGVRFSDGTNVDWNWAANSNSWNRTGYVGKECSGFFGGDIANNVHLFTCNIKTTDGTKVNIGHPNYGSNPTILNKTVNVGSKIKVGNSFDASVASVAAISMQHYSFNSSTYANVQDYYSSNVPTHSKGSTGTYAIYPTYTSTVRYSFSNLTEGYYFVGWYDGDGNLLSQDPVFDKYTTENYDIYAYFAEANVFIEGRFHVTNSDRDGTWTNTFDAGDWSESSANIKFDYDGTNKVYYRHTYATPNELTTQIEKYDPVFYIKISSSSSSITDAVSYWSSTAITLSAADTKQSLTRVGSLVNSNLKFNSDDDTGYAVLYFDESDIWYQLEQALEYDGNDKTGGSAPARTYVERTKSVTAASKPEALVKSGYTFGGWNEAADGSSTNYTAGSSSITMGATNKTVYAKWTQNINLDREGATTGSTSVSATYKSATIGSITNPEKDGYIFAGYYTGEDGAGSCVINTAGVLQANVTNYTGEGGIWTHDGATTLHAKWIARGDVKTACWDGSTYKCSDITDLSTPDPTGTATWSGAAWGGGKPDKTKQVVIPAGMEMRVNENAAAKEVILSSGSTLTIDDNKGLEVAGTITKADGSAPTASDLILASTASGNASLIFTNSNSTAANVEMYSIAEKDGSTWNWQYIGIPVTGGTALDYFNGKYLYKFTGTGWTTVGAYNDVEPFVGYCLTQETAATLSFSGTLVNNNDVDISLIDGQSKVFANSWTAPIYIGGFTSSTFTSVPATIYLFNTGNAKDGSSSGSKGSAAGTYVAVPVKAAEYSGNEVIPSMQGFFIHATTGGTNTMKYDDLVRTTKNNHSVNAGAMYAPKRVKTENDPDVIKIWAESSAYSDKLVVLAREDFSTGFDNGWDGEKKGIVSNAPAIYVLNENSEKDAVSAIPDFEGTVVGFKPATSETEYTVRFEYNGEETLYLNDQKAQTSAVIATDQTYTFDATSEDNEARFVISRTPIKKITTGVDEVTEGTNARKQMINGQLYIVRDGQIYDMLGKTIK